MNAIIYARQSSGDGDISESVEIQKQKCLELAQKEDLRVVGIFDDLNTSGKTYPIGSEDIASLDVSFQNWFENQSGKTKFRVGFGNVLKHLSDIDYILCYDITRLYRPVTGSFLESHISQLLIFHNVKVWTVNNGIIDFNKFNDSLITAIQNRINHEQIAIQKKKSIEATKRLINAGEYSYSLNKTTGYEYDGKRKVKINEREAEMVRDVYNTFLESNSINNTTRIINEKYKDIFKNPAYPQIFKRILRRPVYCGYMYNSEHELIPCKQVIGMEIISFDTWQEVQKRFEKRKLTHPREKKSVLPLSGLVYCGKCGRKMFIRRSEKRNFYECINTAIQKTVSCKSRIYNSHKSKYGLGLIECIYPILALSITERLNISMNKESNQKELNECEVKLKNLIQKEKKISDLYLNELMDESTYKDNLTIIKKEKDILNQKVNKLKLALNTGKEFIRKASILLDKIVFRTLSNSELYTCVHDVINRIDVVKESVTITTIFGSFTLPRQILFKMYNTLPHYYFFPHKDSMTVYYYMGEERAVMFNPDFKNKKHELIADWGRMKIYLIR